MNAKESHTFFTAIKNFIIIRTHTPQKITPTQLHTHTHTHDVLKSAYAGTTTAKRSIWGAACRVWQTFEVGRLGLGCRCCTYQPRVMIQNELP